MAKILKRKQTTKEQNQSEDTEVSDLRDPELDQAVDDLLEEIDSVLEPNAEDFVKGFQQEGGE